MRRFDGLAKIIFIVGVVGVSLWIGQHCGPPSIRRSEVAELLRRAGDSAVAVYRSEEDVRRATSVALRDVADSLDATPTLVTTVRLPADTVYRVDTVVVASTSDSVVSIGFPDLDTLGISISDTVVVAPAPAPETTFTRNLHVRWHPDSVIVALLETSNGLERVVASLGERRLAVVDAVRLEGASRPKRRAGLHCVVGPGAGVGLDGIVRATIGVTCGLGM